MFGGPVRRIPLDAGFTCPTRDGTLGTEGCLYCDADGARAAHVEPELPVREQLARGIARHLERRPATARFIAYFQSYTNTYGPPAVLRRVYEEGLSDPRVVAMAIGSRPDCLPDAVLEVAEDFARRTFFWFEIGLQSMRNDTLQAVRRGHTVEQFVAAAERLRRQGLRLCAHVILGLPGDTPSTMLEAADLLNAVGAWGVKMHNLYIDRLSPLAALWHRGEIALLSRKDYIELAAQFLARLAPGILIHRVLGEAPAGRLLGPEWSANKFSFLKDFDLEMAKKNLWQGCRIVEKHETGNREPPTARF